MKWRPEDVVKSYYFYSGFDEVWKVMENVIQQKNMK